MKVNTTKPLLLVFPFNLLSHYLRCLMLARHFAEYFEVMFAHSDAYADFISREGYQTFNCKSLHAPLVMECVNKFDFSWINEESLESVYTDQVTTIEKLQPVAVLGDTSLTLKMAAEKTGVTFISLMNGYMSKYYSLTRKISRTHPVYKYMNLLPGPLLDLLTEKGESIAFYKLHRPFKEIRAKYHLIKKFSYLDESEGDINLITDLALLFPQNLLPGSYTMIAPLYYDTDVVFSQISQKLDKHKKTIFVTMGSTGDWHKVRFLNNPYFKKYNIVTAGDSRNVLNAGSIIKTPFINVREIFHRTDLVICQGGNGTIYQSLSYGIPLLCKTNNFEQEWNVEALERLQVGRSLDGIRNIDEYIILVDEWIERKGAASNESVKVAVRNEADKLGTIVKRIAAGVV